MNSVKQAISRMGRSVRLLEAVGYGGPSFRPQKPPPPPSRPNDLHPRHRISKEELEAARPYLKQAQRAIFQDFLLPLNVDNLKSLETNKPPFDKDKARANWAAKRSPDRTVNFEMFLQDRQMFYKVLGLLELLTPEHLKHCENVEGVLRKHEEHERSTKVAGTPLYHYGEIPPVPAPLTAESFRQWVYFLTHCKVPYKNLSSLSSGLIPQMLLYTHKLTNEEFKPYRLVQTYNYLIKYFGVDKNQSTFARELLLVMNKDGHKPNIDTINTLLRLCRIHSNIRSVQSTYYIINKYLQLVKRLQMQVNLTTWSRVYDCIHNIFMKEVYINRISELGIPVSRNLALRVVDDFAKTTRDQNELEYFIEHDLNMKKWRNDAPVASKVVRFAISKAKSGDDIDAIIREMGIAMCGETLSAALVAIRKNPLIQDKMFVMLRTYLRYAIDDYGNHPRIFQEVIGEVCRSTPKHQPDKLGWLVRCMIYEATDKLALASTKPFSEQPLEILDAGASNTYRHVEVPHTTPLTENYRIVRRLVGFVLDHLEGALIQGPGYVPLGQALSPQEVGAWLQTKNMIAEHQGARPNFAIAQHLGMGASRAVSSEIAADYQNYVMRKISLARLRDTLAKLTDLESYTRHQMAERGIWQTSE